MMALGDVPPLPKGAVANDGDDDPDVVYDIGSCRWRYRNGELIAFIEYWPADTHDGQWPWRRLWAKE